MSGGVNLSVHFVCQNCAQPLHLDRSLHRLDETTLTDFAGVRFYSNSANDDALTLVPASGTTSMGSSSEVLEVTKKYLLNDESSENGSNGFMVIAENPNRETENFSYTLKVMSKLFDILSDQSDVDHPLCEECTDNLLDQMDEQLKMTEEECKDYNEYLERLRSSPTKENVEELEEELAKLRLEEEVLQKELKEVEEMKNSALRELEEQKLEKERLNREEERYWREYFNHRRQLMLFEEEKRSADNQRAYADSQLNKLKNTNVFNATFNIWFNNEFGTINNFRLGRLPSVPVEWHEINAAWGQTVLLLYSLAKKINLEFKRYRLVPYGNHSYLESLTDKSKDLPLYGSGGIKFFWDTKFDQAMVAFLDCLQQFKEEVERGESFVLPYKMDKGRLEDGGTSGTSYSIKIQFNSEEQWTKALKYMLTNLKWGLTFVSAQAANK